MIAVGLVTAVLATACGSSDDSSGDESAASVDSSSVPTTDVATTAAPTTESVPTTSTAPDTTEVPVADDCPPSVEPPLIEPVDASATDFPPFEGVTIAMPAGRYTTSSLGVSIALDLPTDDFRIPDQVEGAVVATDNPAMLLSMVRSDGYLVEWPESDSVVESLDLDTWLTESGVTVVSDEAITVAGLPAREVRIELPAVEGDDVIPLTAHWGLLVDPSTDKRLIEIDIGDPEPLVLAIESKSAADPVAVAQADQIIASLAIGEHGPSLATVYAASPWNVGNLWSAGRPPLVPAGCLVPMLAFGGSEFELSEASRIRGSGDEIFVIDPDVPYVGVVPPMIWLVAPANEADDNGLPESPRGAPIETTADVIGRLEANGYQLTPIESDATLLGAPVTAFEFDSPDDVIDLWIPSNHAGSNGSANASGVPLRSGQVLIAETDVGVLVATLDGDTGTDDASLLQDRFDTMVATLRPST